jgi:phage terminase large subunit-like protein
LDAASGITSVFFETFDAERFSVHYSDGTTDKLNSGKFTLGANGNSVTFTGLKVNQSNVTVITTLKKRQVTNNQKILLRSKQVLITRTSGISTQTGTSATGLSTSKYYGLRVEDQEISLNVPDVVNIRAVYESTNSTSPGLDKLTFATGSFIRYICGYLEKNSRQN